MGYKAGIHLVVVIFTLFLIFLSCKRAGSGSEGMSVQSWNVHDMNRPRPAVITPGTQSTQMRAGTAPSDAIVLFDGKDLSKWTMENGEPPKWTVKNGYMEVVPKSGYLFTRQAFGDCQLHVEWSAPSPVSDKGQGRGNSGIYLMSRYEIQILDSYENPTYADGQAASIYGQTPPLVNACRPPGQWQSYDIIFRRPRFSADSSLLSPASITLLHNNILVQNNTKLSGPTDHKKRPPYSYHPEKQRLKLQDHRNPIRYRNIWIRELE